MNRDKIDSLIVYLLAIVNYAKDIHYNCYGESFYGQHLFADRFTDDMYEYIDQLKEICLLGHSFKPLHSSKYLVMASEIVPDGAEFSNMRYLMIDCLAHIESIVGISKGDENLIGAIAQDIQNNVGLINIMLKEVQDV